LAKVLLDGEAFQILSGQGDITKALRLQAHQTRNPYIVPVRADGLNPHWLIEKRSGNDLAYCQGEITH
jgi:hypothetical protein